MTSHQTFNKLLLLLVIGFSWGLAARAQNIVANGDFEEPPYAPSSTITSWTVSGTGEIHEAEEGSTSPTHSAAFNIGDDSEGTILSQSFATTNGVLYRLDFDAGIYGPPDANSTLLLNVKVEGSATLLDQTVLPPANISDPTSVPFRHYQFTFTADSDTTTLQYLDIGTGNSSADTVLDTVSIAPIPTPTPSQNVVVNGDFETPPYMDVGTVTGWIVGGTGHVADIGEGATSGAHSAAFNAGGDFQGDTLSQSFTTIIGQVYTLDFDTGIFGPDNGSISQLEVQVVGTRTLLDETVKPPPSNTSNANSVIFAHYHFTFTADSDTTTLMYLDIGSGNAVIDTVLDTVSIAPTPTPAPIPPSITTQPANKTKTVGQTATFSVVATGTVPLSYQWKKNGADIAGATHRSYLTPPTTKADNGALFAVVVSNSAGSVTSNNATLTVNPAIPPSITTQPANKTKTVGQTAKFSVAATGTKPLSYQWKKNGANIAGATHRSYLTPPTTKADNGALFAVVVSNSAGSVTSNNATLTVNPAPTAPRPQ